MTVAHASSALPPLRDRIKPGVRVLFVGINPGVRSAETGHHFAGFSNRFWKLLFEAGLVPQPITYEDDDRLPEYGFGITNICARATPGIDTLLPEEYVAGRVKLRRKILRYKPAVVAMVGVTVFRAMFPERKGAVKLGTPAGDDRRYRRVRAAESERAQREFHLRGDARARFARSSEPPLDVNYAPDAARDESSRMSQPLAARSVPASCCP